MAAYPWAADAETAGILTCRILQTRTALISILINPAPPGDDSDFTPPDMPSGDNSGSGGFTPPGAGNIPDMSNMPGMNGKPGMGALCPAGHERLLHLCGV